MARSLREITIKSKFCRNCFILCLMNDSNTAPMVKEEWKILDRAQSSDLIGRLAGGADADLFSLGSCGVQYRLLPFYRNFVLYRIINYNTMPVFTIDFLGDGDTFYRLDGSADPILLVNSRGDIDVAEDTAMDYIRFFFANVSTDEGDMVLVDNPDDLPFIESLDMQQQLMLKQRHEKPHLTYNAEDDAYVISSDVFYTGSLLRADIAVQRNGQISIEERGMIMADSLNTPYAQGLF